MKYKGWDERYNEWIPRQSYRIAPLHTMTSPHDDEEDTQLINNNDDDDEEEDRKSKWEPHYGWDEDYETYSQFIACYVFISEYMLYMIYLNYIKYTQILMIMIHPGILYKRSVKKKIISIIQSSKNMTRMELQLLII